MKLKYISILLLSVYYSLAAPKSIDYNRLANAINKAEHSAKYPYGIKSINTHGDVELARKICINTIRHNYARWEKTDKKQTFIQFLGNVYCPAKLDKLNENWIKNVTYFYEKY